MTCEQHQHVRKKNNVANQPLWLFDSTPTAKAQQLLGLHQMNWDWSHNALAFLWIYIIVNNCKPTWKVFLVQCRSKHSNIDLYSRDKGIFWDLLFFLCGSLRGELHGIPVLVKANMEFGTSPEVPWWSSETNSETSTIPPLRRLSHYFLLFLEVLQGSRVGERLTLVFGQLHLVRGKRPATVRITVHLHDGTLQAEVVAHLE